MGGLRLYVHPLFLIFGAYYALTGKILIFIIYTLSAVVHELGHSFAAAGLGYRLNKITLMPFGAVASGDIDGLKLKDEIKIALAGPLINLAIGLFFVATWWIFPEIYAFTDVIAEANLSLAIVNLLPVFPLDGGRVLSAVTALKMGKKRSEVFCKVTGAVFSALLLIAFIFTAFNTLNLSLLFFSLFVLFGAFGKGRENKYVKLYTAVTTEKLKRGMEVKRQAVDKSITVKKLMTLLDQTAINEIAVYSGDKCIATLSQAKLNDIIARFDLYSKLEEYI
ncbi:MAG: hypothetical protein E7346_01300 [Clostridiales bacterium]|nr:hypothetical protein [Clostridiales bacterium]MBQ3046624.1 site-2 protease family protein [Clostridia bacterium]